MNILIIEDQPFVMKMLVRAVKKAAVCQITTAPDLSQAIPLISGDTDLIICDMSLPDTDGLAAITALGKNCPSAHIAALSSAELPFNKETILAAGAERVFTKPFRQAALVEYISSLIPNTP